MWKIGVGLVSCVLWLLSQSCSKTSQDAVKGSSLEENAALAALSAEEKASLSKPPSSFKVDLAEIRVAGSKQLALSLPSNQGHYLEWRSCRVEGTCLSGYSLERYLVLSDLTEGEQIVTVRLCPLPVVVSTPAKGCREWSDPYLYQQERQSQSPVPQLMTRERHALKSFETLALRVQAAHARFRQNSEKCSKRDADLQARLQAGLSDRQAVLAATLREVSGFADRDEWQETFSKDQSFQFSGHESASVGALVEQFANVKLTRERLQRLLEKISRSQESKPAKNRSARSLERSFDRASRRKGKTERALQREQEKLRELQSEGRSIPEQDTGAYAKHQRRLVYVTRLVHAAEQDHYKALLSWQKAKDRAFPTSELKMEIQASEAAKAEAEAARVEREAQEQKAREAEKKAEAEAEAERAAQEKRERAKADAERLERERTQREEAMFEKLSNFTGIDKEFLKENRSKIKEEVFAKNLGPLESPAPPAVEPTPEAKAEPVSGKAQQALETETKSPEPESRKKKIKKTGIKVQQFFKYKNDGLLRQVAGELAELSTLEQLLREALAVRFSARPRLQKLLRDSDLSARSLVRESDFSAMPSIRARACKRCWSRLCI